MIVPELNFQDYYKIIWRMNYVKKKILIIDNCIITLTIEYHTLACFNEIFLWLVVEWTDSDVYLS